MKDRIMIVVQTIFPERREVLRFEPHGDITVGAIMDLERTLNQMAKRSHFEVKAVREEEERP